MKKIILLILTSIVLVSCSEDSDILDHKTYPFIIIGVKVYKENNEDTDYHGNKEKYEYLIKNYTNHLYTDSIYNVGDTLILVKRQHIITEDEKIDKIVKHINIMKDSIEKMY